MFGKLKEKLKGWIKKSTEKITESEETLEKKEAVEEVKKEAVEEVKKEAVEDKEFEEKIKKLEEKIEKAKKEEVSEPPLKFEVGKQKYEPDLEKVKEEQKKEKTKEEIQEEIKETEKEIKELEEKDEAEILAEEPPKKGNYLLGDVKNLILTPHIAWSSTEARQRLLGTTTENIKSFINGNPINIVN